MTFIRPAFKFAPPPATQAVEIKFNNSYNKYVTVGYSFSVVGTKPKVINALGFYRSNTLPTTSVPQLVWNVTPPSPTTLPFSATVGYEFQTGITYKIDRLGLYYPSAGFNSEHKITLWNNSGNPIAIATMPSGTCTPIDNFCWVDIPGGPITIPAGTYRVGAFYDVDGTGFSVDPLIEQVSPPAIGVNPIISANFVIGYSALGDAYPTAPGDPNNRSFFGPNVGFLTASDEYITTLWDDNGNVLATTGVVTGGAYSQDNFRWNAIPTITLLPNSVGDYYVLATTYKGDSPYVVESYTERPTQFLTQAEGYQYLQERYSYNFSNPAGVGSFPTLYREFKPLLKWNVTPPSPTTLPFSATVGYEFQTAITYTIDRLGLYYPSAGFNSEHKITLWNNSGNPIAIATMPSGVCTPIDNFCWVSIPGGPITIPAGNYRVGAFYDVDGTGNSNDPFMIDVPSSSIGENPSNSSNFIVGYLGLGDAYPTFSANPGFRSYFGPNVGFVTFPSYFGPNLSYLPELANGAYTEYGFKFTALENKTVRGVGVHDVNSDGLESNVQVKVEGITNPENNWTFNVGIGSTLPLVKGYRYQETSAFTLPAGDYRIFAQDTSVIGIGTTSETLIKFSPSDPISNYEVPGETFPTTVGYEFVIMTGNVFLLEALGIYHPSGGLQKNNKVSIWSNTNTTKPIVSVGFPTGVYNNLIDNFCYINLQPPILLPSSTYRVGVYYTSVGGSPAENFVPEYPSASIALGIPGFNLTAGFASLTDSYPSDQYTTTPGYASVFGPNLKFSPAPIITPAFKFAPPPAVQPEEIEYEVSESEYKTVGYKFAISQPKIINALGYYNSPNNVGNVSVSIWDINGFMIATTGIASTCTYSQDGFCWIIIEPFELPAIQNSPTDWYIIGATYQGNNSYVIDSYGTISSQVLIEAVGYDYLGGVFSPNHLSPSGQFPTVLLNDSFNAGIFGPNLSYIDTNALKIAKQTDTISEVPGIEFTNNLKRNPITTGITTVTADANAYFGPVLFVEVYN